MNGRPSLARYGVLGLLCAAAAVAYLSRNSIAVAEEAVRLELELSDFQMGWVMSAFFLSYAVFQIPGGWLGDVWGGRRTLAACAVAWSLSTVAMGLAVGFWSLLAARLAIGAAQAGLFPAAVSAIAKWLPATRQTLACGLLASFMSVGGALAVALTGLLLEGVDQPARYLGPLQLPGLWLPALSWRVAFLLFAAIGLLWALGFFYWFRNRPEEHSAVNRQELELIRGRQHSVAAAASPAAGPVPWAALLTSADMWWIGGQQFFRAAGYIFYATWFPKFLKETRDVSTVESGYLTSLPLLAVVVGSLVGGLVVDWIWVRTGSRRWSRQGVAVPSMLACAALIFAAYFAAHPLTAVLLITLGTFCAAFGGPCGYTITIDKGGRHVSTVFSIMNMAGNLGAAACPVVVQQFVQVTGNWNLVLFLFAGIYVAAALCWALVNPQGNVGQ